MKAFHWPTAAQFGFSIFALLNLLGLAFGAALLGLVQLIQGEAASNALQLLLLAAGAAGVGLVVLPSAGYSFLRLIGRPAARQIPLPGWMRPTLLILALPLVMAAGYFVSRSERFSWLALPPLHLLAVGLPVLWLVYLALRDLPTGSPQRVWGLFGSGAVLAPVLAFTAEILLLLAGILALGVWVSTQPGLAQEFRELAARLQQAGTSPAVLEHILAPYLARPAVWFVVFAYVGLLVPMLEELIKPVGVWLLAGRGLSPAEGWAAGILSGAGFALAESLMLASRGEDWAFLVFARIGTGVIHALTAGMLGWALAVAWRDGRYGRLGGVYLASVGVHALWNALTIASTASVLAAQGIQFVPDWALQMSRAFPYVLGGLAFTALLALLAANTLLLRDVRKVKNGVDILPD